MSLTVLTGLPGSGKSKYLIEQVLEAREQSRPVKTFECSESPWLQADEYVRDWRLIGSRVDGLKCALDHFVSTAEAKDILNGTPPGALVAFEEAHYFDAAIVSSWLEASGRGLDVLVARPSDSQLARLDGNAYEELKFGLQCGRCGVREAVTFVLLPDAGPDHPESTTALCEVCDAEVTAEARSEIVDRLERGSPYPGEKTIYQPVELEECADWWCLRPDSEKRFEIMAQVLRDAGLVVGDRGVLEDSDWSSLRYVDIGCNTGFFCSRLRVLGFYVEGVDVVQEDIELARLLGSFVRRQKINYVISDCYEYLRDTRDQVFDVTSAFSVFQWLMLQRTAEHGLECIDWLFEKTGRICFLEMGYNDEPFYDGKLPLEIDRPWVEERMQRGAFADILVFDAAEHGLQRDLFVGIKEPALARAAARTAQSQRGAMTGSPANFEPDPIVVYGAPRSGTTYVQRILNVHPDVFISHESRVFAWLHHSLKVLAQDDRLLITYREDFVQHLRAEFPRVIRDFYRKLAPEASQWGDKNPHYADGPNAGCLDLIVEVFPGARFIHIIRDGRDVVSSLVRKRDPNGNPWATFEAAHHTWTSHTDRGAVFGRALPPNQYFEFYYEDLVADDLAVAGELFRFLGLELDPEVEVFCRSEQDERTPFSGPTRDLKEGIAASDWPQLFKLEEQVRSLELLGAHLVRYGYETEASLAQLKERTANALASEHATSV